jgi:uncharacterized protein YcbX
MAPHRGRLAWIAIAPVKSMALVQLAEARLERTGIPGDRAFAVVDHEMRLVNGKRIGALVGIQPTWDPLAARLTLRFPDGHRVDGEVDLGEATDAVFFGRTRPARRVLGPWAEALSDWAGRELHLVAPMGDGTGIDRGPSVSLLSTGALGVLSAAEGLDGPVDGRRFRMTLGIAEVEPFEEDAWMGREVRVGGAIVRPVDHVGRCAVTTQDPDTGIPDFPTLRVLQRLRGHISSPDEDLPCGVLAEVVRPGDVRLGDPVGPMGDRAGSAVPG